MRKLLVAVSAVLLVGMGASAAQAQKTQKCPSPEQIKFDKLNLAPQTISGITYEGQTGNTLTFTVESGFVVDRICVKAGTTATVFEGLVATNGSTNFTLSTTCTVIDIEPDGDLDLWAQSGDCTVTITRNAGPGFSHVTFYGDFYVQPEPVVAPLVAAQGESSGSGGAALAFTGAQLSIMLAILAGLILAGTLAWTAGRRRAAKID